ncbi:MAG: AAA family ATPase, partial [Candidatus Omnitrophica bacterium]|nr:AAA family ATPase [Candidatus Omnitrophota bacterium]
MKKGQIFVLSAPSGTGKTTIARRLAQEIPELTLSVSLTTRLPRAKEENGKDYQFVSRKKFERLIEKKAFAEWAKVYGHY